MDQTTHKVRMENWMALIERCQARPEGQTQKQWLAENGVSEKQFYYWLRKIRNMAYHEAEVSLPCTTGTEKQVPRAAFAEIPVETIFPDESGPAVTITTRKSTIRISSAVSETLMIELVKAVAHAL